VVGPAVPGYRILGELGRGGMGVVYKARQIGLARTVALKMILSGDYAAEADLVRFRLEAEAVAKLQHPNIVQIYEINEWDGRPYFALEFVDGGPLDKKLGGNPLPFRQAAELLRKLAEAMDYAHQRHIIHRDLKPPNVLLTADGTPKITDFGLAKKLDEDDSQTRTGAIMGTPSYMAPEQAEGRTKELGPAADIYSLGAILYELLVGRPPFKGSTVWDTLEQVRTQEPVYPSRLHAKVPRDLETICLKCLEKEAPKRYASAGALAEDLRRYLGGEPVLARPTPAWERAWKWARRRPLAAALVGVSALFAVSLAAGGVAFGEWERRQAAEQARLRGVAEDEHRQAEENFRQAELNFQRAELNFQRARLAVDEMLTGVGQQRLAHEPRMERVRRELLAKALHFYQRFLEEKGTDPGVRWETARAHLRVGDIRRMLGEQGAAEAAYADGRAMLAGLLDQFPGDARFGRDLTVGENNLGRLLRDAGRTPEAEEVFRSALARRQRLVEEGGEAEDRQELAAVADNLGILLLDQGRYAQSEPLLRQALGLREQLAAGSPNPAYRLELARSHNNLGLLLAATGRPDDAEQTVRQALAALKRLQALTGLKGPADDNPDAPDYRQELVTSHTHIGNFWRDTQPRRAEAAYEDALRLCEQLVADFPTVPAYRQQEAASHHSLGLVRQAAGRQADAEHSYARALAIRQKLADDYATVPEYRFDLAATYNNRGILLLNAHRLADAEKAYDQALPPLEKLAAEHRDEARYQQELASVLQNQGVLFQLTNRSEQAEKNIGRAFDLRRQLAADHPRAPGYLQDMASAEATLGTLWQLNGRLPEAEKCYGEAADQLTRLAEKYPAVPDYRHLLANVSNNLGNLLRATKRPAEAEKAWQKARDLLTALKDEQPGVPIYRQELAQSYNELGIFLASTTRRGDAIEAFGQALAVQEKLTADFPTVAAYREQLAKYSGNLGLMYVQINRPRAAQGFRRAIALLEDLAKESPDVAAYWEDLIFPYSNLINLSPGPDDPPPSLERCWRRLVELREKLADVSPKSADAQSNLAAAENGLARLMLEVNNPAEARHWRERAARHQRTVADLNRAAVEQSPQSAAARGKLGGAHLALAQTLVELEDHVGAAAAVADLVNAVPAGARGYHVSAATVLARCAGLAAKDAPLAATYGDRALDLLRQAIALGYKDAAQLRSAAAFEPLRSRDDFQKLLAELEQKGSSGPK
jgi:tetratricopeptide (TPR) repeat protein